MFDNVKNTICAAETVLDNISAYKDSAKSSLEYWNEKIAEYERDNPGGSNEYYANGKAKTVIELQMYEAIEKTVKSFVKDSINK